MCYIKARRQETHPPVAQLVEQLPFKQTVEGSSPSGRTKIRHGGDCLTKDSLRVSRNSFKVDL